MEAAARALMVQLLNLDVRQVGDLEPAFEAAGKAPRRRIRDLEDPIPVRPSPRITDLARSYRWGPAVHAQTGT